MALPVKSVVLVFLASFILVKSGYIGIVIDRFNCRQIEDGATMDRVLDVVGEPKYRRAIEPSSRLLVQDPPERVTFWYNTPYFASGPITIAFKLDDNEDYIVSYTFCEGSP